MYKSTTWSEITTLGEYRSSLSRKNLVRNTCSRRLGSNKAFSAKARQRYFAHFGQTNYQVPVANHSLVFIDAPGLVEEDYVRYEQEEPFEDWTGMPGGTIEYVNRLSQGMHLVFSHSDGFT
jgi:hypothetical protein